MAKKFNYKQVETDYLEMALKSHNPIRRWFHKQRYETLNKWLAEEFHQGMVIADLGCSICAWNNCRYPVIGVDINQKMLKQAKLNGRIIKYKVTDLINTRLRDNSIDIVILSEVLEYLYNYEKVILESYRILKPGGKIFVSVPYDTNFSLWKPFFNIYCIYRGYILGEKFYRLHGGHVIHFSPKKIKRAIVSKRFNIVKQFSRKRFTIYTIAQKDLFMVKIRKTLG